VGSARDAILEQIRGALADGPGIRAVPRAYRVAGDLERPARIELLCRRIGDYRAEVHRVRAAELQGAIADAFEQQAAQRIAVPAGLPHDWRPAGCQFVEDSGLSPAELDQVDGVLTGCTVAIAETGTLVLAGGPAEGRRALTLVPDLHVCVVAESQVVELVPEALALLAGLVRNDRSPLTFISGPSATSDIELSRVEGVHGPRTLIVLVVAQEPTP
jgi:L-lactate dehydrogenase complex protein LldG